MRYVWELFIQQKGCIMSEPLIGFNYEAIEEKLRAPAKEHARKIRGLLQRSTSAVIEIGHSLADVHKSLGHSRYQAWLKAEFRWSQTTASNYEQIATKFGNLKCLDQFQPSALMLLVRRNVDPRAMTEAVKRAERGEMMTYRQVVQILHRLNPRPKAAVPNAAAAQLRSADPLLQLRTLVKDLAPRLAGEQRKRFADELLELACQLRSGRDAAGEPCELSVTSAEARKPAAASGGPERREPAPSDRPVGRQKARDKREPAAA
jgi:hypothetical protein